MALWSKFADWLKENPWWGALGFLVGLIGVIIAIILFMIGRRTKKPVYARRSTNLIQDFTSRFEKLEIKYAGEQIANFTATKVVFWNDGKETINSGDIVSADPLIIRVKNGYKILDPSVLHPKEDANPNQFEIIPVKEVKLEKLPNGIEFPEGLRKKISHDESKQLLIFKGNMSKEEKDKLLKLSAVPQFTKAIEELFKMSQVTYVLIQFDYLDTGEGGVIQLLHTGKSSDDVEVCGIIKGAGKPKFRSFSIAEALLPMKLGTYSFHLSGRRIYAVLLFAISVAIIVSSLFSTGGDVPSTIPGKIIMYIIILVMFWGPGFYLIKRHVPKGLDEIFFEEISKSLK